MNDVSPKNAAATTAAPTRQIDAEIMGHTYRLACPEGGEAALRAAVSKVDAAMCEIRDAGKVKTRERIAVLSALNMAFALAAQPVAAYYANPSASDAAAPSDAESEARLNDLLTRLDQALEDDGQLL